MTAPGDDEVHFLYRHWNADGLLLYVGVATDPFRRLADHRQRSRWFFDVVRVSLHPYSDRGKALQAETDAIQSEAPLFNVRRSVAIRGKPRAPDPADVVHACPACGREFQ